MATTDTPSAHRRPGSRVLVSLMIGAATLFAVRSEAATSSNLYPRVTTNHGCIETGDAATFAIGDTVIVFLSVGSSTFDHVNATLFAIKPPGFVTAISFGSIATNVPLAFAARVGAPAGVHTLQLRASAGGASSRRSCSFHVVPATTTRTPRPSASATRTPTPSKTPTATSSTPTTGLRPSVRTNRGCKETGQDPTFVVGELISVSYGVGSDAVPLAFVTLFDLAPGGNVSVLRNRTVQTNVTYTFKATVAPPTGVETLKLRASATGLPTVTNLCSFTVVRPAVRTRTPTRTATPSPTPTATPTP